MSWRGGGGGGGRGGTGAARGGAYYKSRYGGGGGGGGGGAGFKPRNDAGAGGYGFEARMDTTGGDARGTAADLARLLQRIDGTAYGAYKQLGSRWYAFAASGAPRFELSIAHVQSDAYAAPSRVVVRCTAGELALPVELLASRVRRVALCDFLTRRCCATMRQFEERAQNSSSFGDAPSSSGSGWAASKGGDLRMAHPGACILERSSVQLLRADDSSEWTLEARFELGLPASGRTIEGRKAHTILCETVPRLVQQSFLWLSLENENEHQTKRQHSAQAAHEHVICAEDQAALRGMLEPAGLVAFVPDGAILPRLHGASELPMPSASALPFSSPDALRVSMTLPSGKTLTGMGIRKGVNLIVGGGFHGKSTLLQAIELGVYDHVPGDGREFVSCLAFASKMRAEDGRAVTSLDISPFISNLPFGRATNDFSTADASGSTSQAANIAEALEMGCDLLIFDEDTCATNFMYRDAVMSALVGKHKEPITPFLERVRVLYESHGISSLLVVGSCGAFFDVADTVIMMDCYKAYDVSDEAKSISCAQGRGGAQQVSTAVLDNDAELSALLGSDRKIHLRSLAPAGGSKVYVRDMGRIQYGSEEFAINLRALEQLVELGQTRLIADAMQYVEMVSKQTAPVQGMKKLVARVEAALDAKGLDAVAPSGWKGIGYYSRPRPIELAAAINRWRLLKVSIDASVKD